MTKKNKKLALNSGIQTYQILTNDDEVCIQSLSSILLDVLQVILARYIICHYMPRGVHFYPIFQWGL